jgi:hypothetical protein
MNNILIKLCDINHTFFLVKYITGFNCTVYHIRHVFARKYYIDLKQIKKVFNCFENI